MKRLLAVIGSMITLLLFVVAGMLLVRLMQSRPSATTLQEPQVSSTTSDWETVTLEQIHFGESNIIFTNTLDLQIVRWVSNDELLILRAVKPGGRGEAIELFNLQTGHRQFFGEKSGAGEPVWLPAQQTVAVATTDYKAKKTTLSFNAEGGGLPQQQPELKLSPYITVSSDGNRLLGFESDGWPPVLIDTRTNKLQAIPFDWTDFAPPSEGPRRYYQVDWNPHTSKVVFYNAYRLLLADMDSGKMTEVTLETDERAAQNRPSLSLWALDVQWSPNGEKLAVIATSGQLPNTYRQLYVYNLETESPEKIDLPAGFILNNLTWAPNSRYLLVQGDVGFTENGIGLQKTLLVDITTDQVLEKNIHSPQSIEGPNAELVWSPDGHQVVFHCDKMGQDYFSVCLSEMEVQK